MIIRLFMICVFFTSALVAVDTAQTDKTPDAIKSDMTKFDTDISKAWSNYTKALEKVKSDTKTALSKKMKDAMSNGNLDLANSIKKELDNLDTRIEELEKTFKDKNVDLLGDKNLSKINVIGKWNVFGMWSGVVELKENGSVLGLHNNTNGKWSITSNKLIITWTHFSGGETYDIGDNINELSGVHKNTGSGVSGNIKIIRQK